MQFFPDLHRKFEEAVQYLDTNYSREELSLKNSNILTLSEDELYQKASDPKYDMAFNMLGEIRNDIFHSQRQKKYIDESDNLSRLFRSYGVANLFADDDFIIIICNMIRTQSISSVNIIDLMKATNPDNNRILAIHNAHSTYINRIFCNLVKLRQAVEELIKLTTDELRLAYLNQFISNLAEQMNGYEDNEEPPECEG